MSLILQIVGCSSLRMSKFKMQVKAATLQGDVRQFEVFDNLISIQPPPQNIGAMLTFRLKIRDAHYSGKSC